MRKVFCFNMMTIDGFFEGPNREIDWHHVDGEFNEFAAHQLNEVDILLFGRVTYELMANYWPSESAVKNDPIIANKMNAIPKIVFSKTLKKVEWNNTRIVQENIAKEISKLKQQPGKDIAIFGSSNLAANLSPLDFVDEYRIMINPVILGKGHPLFNGIDNRLDLKLVKAKTFNSGNVLLYYQIERREQVKPA
jgi:dihydrofolate reductase